MSFVRCPGALVLLEPPQVKSSVLSPFLLDGPACSSVYQVVRAKSDGPPRLSAYLQPEANSISLSWLV
jgi:hypothetical protein